MFALIFKQTSCNQQTCVEAAEERQNPQRWRHQVGFSFAQLPHPEHVLYGVTPQDAEQHQVVEAGEEGGGQQAGADQALDAPVPLFGDGRLGKSGKVLRQRPDDDGDVNEQYRCCCNFKKFEWTWVTVEVW